METQIEHIVFDVGRVLIQWDMELPYRALIPHDASRKWFLDNVCTHEWNLEQDRGRSWRDAEAEAIGRHPDHAPMIRAFRAHWHQMVPGDIPETVEMLRLLIAGGHDVTLLTNFAGDTFAEARERFGFLGLPRGATVSDLIGHLKPERQIYEHHVQAFGLDPSATLFIDDSQKNVDGARAAGWQAVLFTNAKTLKGDLERFGIYP